MRDSLEGQVALVTGASRGIGRAIAVQLSTLGAQVVINYRSNEQAAKETLSAVAQAGGRPFLCQADVSRSNEATALVKNVLAQTGQLDILVNNAGIQRGALVHQMSDEDWHEVLNTNLSAAFYTSRAALPAMLEARSGHIVNVSSASGFMGQRGAASYVASKHALTGLTRALAAETASKGIRVNTVAPGLTDTDLVRHLDDHARTRLLGMVPMKRIAEPEEVARMVGWVVTGATYSTGNTFHISGGVVMG